MNIDVNIQLSHMLAGKISISGEESAIIDVIHKSNHSITSDTLLQEVQNLFHVNFSQERISRTLRNMIAEGKIIEIEGMLTLAPATLEELNRVLMENTAIEVTALSQWQNSYSDSFCVVLSESDRQFLNEAIMKYIARFFLEHGAGCYEFINGVKNQEAKKLDEIAIEVVESLNVTPDIVLDISTLSDFLPSVFNGGRSVEQEAYLLLQLRKAVHYLSMVVDKPTVSALLESLNGIIVYLDTSIIYRLLNLQGEERYKSIIKLYSFCKEANMQLRVFQCTVEELNRRIAYDANVIINHPLPVPFATIGYNARTSDNYISTFWNERAKTGISAEDFNFRYKDVLANLDRFGIEIDEASYEDTAEINALRYKVREYGQFSNYEEKSENAVEHDAACLAHIAHIQRTNSATAIEARCFFLSSDWSLIKLQRKDHDYKERTDMVVLPSQLMQIFCLAKPQEDYLEAFLGLFASSQVGFGTNKLDNEQLQKIMGRVSAYSDRSDFAQRVLCNQLVQQKFSEQETEEAQTLLIDEAIREEIERLEIENQLKSDELSSAQEETKQAQKRLDEFMFQSKEKERNAQEQTKQLEATYLEQKRRQDDTISSLRNEVEFQRHKIDDRDAQLEASQRRMDSMQNQMDELLEYKNATIRKKAKLKRIFSIVLFIGVLILWITIIAALILNVGLLFPKMIPFARTAYNWAMNVCGYPEESLITFAAFVAAFEIGAITGGFKLLQYFWKQSKRY